MPSHTRTQRVALSSVLATVLVFILAVLGSRHQVRSPDLQANGQILSEAHFRQPLPSSPKYHSKVPVVFGRNVNDLTRQASGDSSIDFVDLPDYKKLELYATGIRKGGSYLCELRASIDDADKLLSDKTGGKTTNSQSKWTDFSSLQTWGWTTSGAFGSLTGEELFEDAYEEYGLDVSNDKEHAVRQNRDVIIDGKTYPRSKGFYQSIYNVVDGVIIADNSKSPPESMKKDVDSTKRGEVVLLRTWADLTFLMWRSLAGQNVQNLKHIFRATISNEQTLYNARKAVEDTGKKIGGWADRVTFTETGVEGVPADQDTDKGNGLRVLLSSPNGSGIYWLLLNHKAQFGIKTLTKVTVWADDPSLVGTENWRNMDLCLHFQISDV